MKMDTHTATLYHRKATGKIKVWSCWVDGEWVHSEWSQQGGKLSRTKERSSAKLNMTASERAIEKFQKKIARRKKKGYVSQLANVVADIQVDDTTLDFDRLPKSFAPAKPIKKVDIKEMSAAATAGKIFIQRKRDGMRHFLVSDTKGRVRIYSSGKDDVTEHLSPLLKGMVLPPRTVVDCELVVTGANGKDEFQLVASIARSLPERARSRIALTEKAGGRVELFAFDLLWESGTPIYRCRYEDRYMRLAKVIRSCVATDRLVRMPLVSLSPTRLATLSEAIDLVKRNKWEGLVLWRKDQATVVHVNGSPARCNCWKLKSVGEEDVVATGYELGKGKNANVVGKFRIAFYQPPSSPTGTDMLMRRADPQTRSWKDGHGGKGSFKPMGKCGTGLSDKLRAEALKWKYPCVIQIEYDQVSEKGFRFPVFIRKRDDKKISDCSK